jgi:predicted DNA-binding protein YlxM (UPF0122 family)
MKLTDSQKDWIDNLNEMGFSSREIERRTGISKSAVNYHLTVENLLRNRFQQKVQGFYCLIWNLHQVL